MEIGKKLTTEWIVTKSMLANEVGSGSLPVLSTPMCVALLENTAAALIQDELEEEITSVGIRICINHIAATPEGMKVRGEAVLTAIEGRKYTFSVAAFDEKEKIAEGEHERFAVRAESFLLKAEKKALQ